MGIRTQDIEKLCLPDCKNNFKRIEEAIDGCIKGLEAAGGERRTYFAVVVLDRRNDYPRIKSMLTRLNVLSQVIVKSTAARMNLSVASNIMKQINTKVGGESLRVKFPPFMQKERVMVIGIDVCHAGQKSVVGFAASTNTQCTSYFSDIII
jgi:hypothetical protein